MIFLVHGITSKLINLYPVGRFQKFVKFDQSKGRVSVDPYGLDDQGLGTGLVVRGAAVVK
jgi:hypothetical protein